MAEPSGINVDENIKRMACEKLSQTTKQMTTKQADAITNVLCSIVGGIYREIGQTEYERLMHIISTIKNPVPENNSQVFTPNEYNICVNCGEVKSAHRYNNFRCANTIAPRKPRTLKSKPSKP